MSEQPACKRAKTERKVIGTHSGSFHCDEALAVYLLRLTKTYEKADVVRTRDPAKLAPCHIVVDVGGVYDVESQRFDHHQRGFQEVFGEGKHTTIKLSSAGLVYKHFGQEIIANRLQLPILHSDVQTLFLKLYSTFIEPIDAIDNGISQFDGEPRYKVRTDLSSRVGWLNPTWRDKVDDENLDQRFEKASNLAGEEFVNRLDFYAHSWLPARSIVEEAIKQRHQIHTTGKIILFESFVPWKEHLFDLEEELSISSDDKPLYVIYPDENANNWRIQAVPVSPESFQNRKSLPEAWQGLRDEELSAKTCIPGCIFVHASGFIGGNQTKEGVLEMAFKALAID
ncbi:hypothetical protein Clacol_009981 [Clathrus columnatus]|uniref:GAMM1 protein n=1 Tax=Clathrus columnatus TaxID=1419009 RepID=A0AAV5ASU0_9AGAM|nr:hypothetical protein Clacol_009981 [Clathrus columnatus]